VILTASRTRGSAQAKKARAGGSIIGDIYWGSHICQLYQTKQDLIDSLVPYFKAGLENNELCMWITSRPLKTREATAALKGAMEDLDRYITKGHIEIIELEKCYSRTGEFDVDGVLQLWLDRENLAFHKGLDGLRVSAHTLNFNRREWPNIVGYESAVDTIIKRHKMIAVCSYSLDQCGVPEVVDIVSNHRFILLMRQGKWELIENTGYRWLNELSKTGISYAEIGRKLGLTRERVRQIISNREVSNRILPDNQMMTVAEAARLLHVHVNTLRRWNEQGMLPCYRIGTRGDRRYRLTDLLDFAGKHHRTL
jgi:excisionase family DNA binding protein